jgi:hypothetical protein
MGELFGGGQMQVGEDDLAKNIASGLISFQGDAVFF